jgi:hypothetical protein
MWCLKRYLLLFGNDEDIIISMKMWFIGLKSDCLHEDNSELFSNIIGKWWYQLQSFGLILASSWMETAWQLWPVQHSINRILIFFFCRKHKHAGEMHSHNLV